MVLSSNPPRTTTSEADGSFAFDNLVGRPYTLVARSVGGTGGPVTTKLTATSDPVELRLSPAGSVTVLTVDGQQHPVVATVELRGLDTQTGSAGPDGMTRFATVVPGRYDVVAQAKGFAATFSFVAVAAAPVELTMVLVPGAPVVGRVLDAGGAPVGDALVTYNGASDWNIRTDERRDGVRSAQDGGFRFEALPAGSFRFVARHPAHAPGTSSIVTLDGTTAKDGVEIRLTAGATVRGQVVDGAGAPVASARVRLGAPSRGMIGSEPRQVFSGDDGTFTVAGLPRKKLEAVALSARGSSATVAVDTSAGDVRGVTLTVDITGTIAGVVVDRQGEPLEGMQVSAAPDFRSGNFDPAAFRLRGFPQELTDAGGRFELAGLAPGSYMVRASRSSGGRGRTMGMDGERADTGTRDLRIVLPADGGVKGKVAFADGTVPTPFTVGVGFTQEPVASKDGSFVLGDLPPRTYQLVVRGPRDRPEDRQRRGQGGRAHRRRQPHRRQGPRSSPAPSSSTASRCRAPPCSPAASCSAPAAPTPRRRAQVHPAAATTARPPPTTPVTSPSRAWGPPISPWSPSTPASAARRRFGCSAASATSSR